MDDLLKSPSTEYNDPNHTFVIKGNLSLPVLKEAYRKIMVEYPPFSSIVEVDNGNPYFVPQENFELPFKLLTIDKDTDAEHVEKMLSDLVNVPFNLGRELPCRFCCIRKGELHYLFHSFHHLVMDGMSVRTFFDRLTTIYNQLIDNRYVAENQMEQLLQFNKVLDSQFKTNNATDTAYWKHYIEDVPVKVILPQAVYDNTKTTDAPNTWRFRLGEEMDSKVSGLCKQCNTTHFRVYSAVWA
ncbi:MAG: condensation domain-containing protein, partial [Prevotella sp.]